MAGLSFAKRAGAGQAWGMQPPELRDGFLMLGSPVLVPDGERVAALDEAGARVGAPPPVGYVRALETLGPGDFCNAFSLFRPEMLRTYGALDHLTPPAPDLAACVVFAKGFQGDFYAWRPDELRAGTAAPVWLLPRGCMRFGSEWEDAQVHAPDFETFLGTYRTGTASPTLRTPFFVPWRFEWQRASMMALSGHETARAAQDALAATLARTDDARILLRIDGPRSVQQHLYLPPSGGWLVATIEDAATIRNRSTDTRLELRVPAADSPKEVLGTLTATLESMEWLVESPS